MQYTSCFIGIPLPAAYQAEFEAVLGKLGELIPSARLVRKQTPHITLYYLDEQSQMVIDEIVEVMKKHSSLVKNSRISISGLGVFDPEFIRVLFAKVTHDESLVTINQCFRTDLRKFYAEDNYVTLHAHLTLARLPNDEARREFTENEHTIKMLLQSVRWDFEVSELVLYGVDSTHEVELHQKIATIEV